MIKKIYIIFLKYEKKNSLNFWYYWSRWFIQGAEILLKKNYVVHGVKRRSSSINTSRVDHIYQDPHDKKIIDLDYIMETLIKQIFFLYQV